MVSLPSSLLRGQLVGDFWGGDDSVGLAWHLLHMRWLLYRCIFFKHLGGRPQISLLLLTCANVHYT
jgi:hypothetical protein